MFLSKSNLVAVEASSGNLADGAMAGVKVESDGTTIATDGSVMLIVEPVKPGMVQLPPVGELLKLGAKGAVFAASIFKKALRNLPGSKAGAGMQYAACTERVDGKLELTTIGLGQPEERVSEYPLTGEFMNWRAFVKESLGLGNSIRGNTVKVAVSRKKLIGLLGVIDKACPDPAGYDSVFLEVSEGGALVLKAVNYATDQRVFGLVMPLNIGGEWLKPNEWEHGLIGVAPSAAVKKPVAKKVKK